MTGHPTVRQLLAGTVLDGASLLGGAGGLEQAVADVHLCAPTEPDLTRFSAHAALVLDDPSGYQLETLLPRARVSQASALIVHTATASVLSSTRWLADRLALPLVSASGATPLDLAQRLHALVHSAETQRGLTCARLAAHLSRRPASPASTVRALNTLLPARCAILSSEGTPLAGEAPTRQLDDTLRTAVAATIRDESGVLVALPAGTTGRRGAPLWLIAETPDVTDAELDTVKAALDIAAWAVTAWSTTNQLEAARDAAFQSSVLTELLTLGDQVTPPTVEQALEAGWTLDGWHIGVRIRPTATTTPRSQATTSRLRHALEFQGLVAPLVELGGSWAAWLSERDEPTPSRFSAIINAVRRSLTSIPGTALVAGIGRAQPGPSGLAKSLTEAWELAQIAGLSPGRHRVEHADTTDPRRLILTVASGNETVRRSHLLLGALLEPANKTLLDTLETYLTLESSASATAKSLHVHRNTVLKRLDRIEKLLDMRLEDPAIRFALRIACRAAR
ncbi:PucR family transcriptional regulator [Streptomyces sp. NPDC059169]|uniref:PucR family transcriptional regulator n=1 Tax=Streptomyces sp. NPDC059169 TaxID=3346754 RepID=UPI0036B735C1